MKKILIVEDNKEIAELEKDYLEINGFAVDIANDGRVGLQLILENEYSLILLDVMLPYIDGFEILKQVREKKEIPILLVSARKEESDKIRGLGFGADDYITKPFSPGELVARVNSQIQKYERLKQKFSSVSLSTAIQVRGLEIQTESHRVYLEGKEIDLAKKEFELLLLLATNPNKVFSKEELFEKVWGLDAFGDAATVTVHVARLREKIEHDSSESPFIETLWGRGYRFRR